MGKGSKIKTLIILLFFITALYFVEYGVAGSNVVAAYNNGYGTFDMKSYNVTTVNNILGDMDARGLNIYKLYYVFDFLFIIAFAIFQISITKFVYSWYKGKAQKVIIHGIPIARALFDALENCILLYSIYCFPNVNEGLINTSAAFTQIKLLLIKLWVAQILMGIVAGRVLKNKAVKNSL